MSMPRMGGHKRKARPGIVITPAIRAAYDQGDLLATQQLILAHLKREIDGPRTVARMRGGRKILKAV